MYHKVMAAVIINVFYQSDSLNCSEQYMQVACGMPFRKDQASSEFSKNDQRASVKILFCNDDADADDFVLLNSLVSSYI